MNSGWQRGTTAVSLSTSLRKHQNASGNGKNITLNSLEHSGENVK